MIKRTIFCLFILHKPHSSYLLVVTKLISLFLLFIYLLDLYSGPLLPSSLSFFFSSSAFFFLISTVVPYHFHLSIFFFK